MKHSITFCGYRPNEDWKHYQWNIAINGVFFEYKTGVGIATPRNKTDRGGSVTGWNKKPENSILCEQSNSWAHIPSIDDVLECLFSDAEFGQESFNDFCSNLGYSNDSLKALDIYRACMENAEKLRKALGKEYSEIKERIGKGGAA